MGALAAPVLASAAPRAGAPVVAAAFPSDAGDAGRLVAVRAVVFDVGETLVDETRIWSDWADWLGIPRLTFMAVLGALIERGGDHLDPLRLFVPGIDIKAEFAKRADAGVPDDLRVDDLYPDAVPALRALIAAGYRVGIVGNQPTRAEAVFNGLGMALDFVASSASWGVAKPDPAFFARLLEMTGNPGPGQVAYAGDRVDNDVIPAAAAGMRAIWVRRGPWGMIQRAGNAQPALTVDSLDELVERINEVWPAPGT